MGTLLTDVIDTFLGKTLQIGQVAFPKEIFRNYVLFLPFQPQWKTWRLHKFPHWCICPGTLKAHDNDSVGTMVNMGDFHVKLAGFGFDVYEINGHDLLSKSPIFSISSIIKKPFFIKTGNNANVACPLLIMK